MTSTTALSSTFASTFASTLASTVRAAIGAIPLALCIVCSTSAFAGEGAAPGVKASHTLQLQQIRNATVKITYGSTTFLVDPMLAKKGTYPGFENTYRSELRNPLVDLPESASAVIDGVDAVIVTHTHLDHWDHAAQQALAKNIPLYTQNEEDAQLIRSQGFENVRVLSGEAEFGGVRLTRTGGQHGTDGMYALPALGKMLGEAMGVVFQMPGYKTMYLAGDTIWRKDVDRAIDTYRPEVIVLNAGKAKLTGFEASIIMGEEDVLRASQVARHANIVAVHLDAINHMSLTRKELQAYVEKQGIDSRVDIPADGMILKF